MRKKNSSQYCPYLQASFHARAIPRICRIPETHMQSHSPSHGSSSSTLFGGTILKRDKGQEHASFKLCGGGARQKALELRFCSLQVDQSRGAQK